MTNTQTISEILRDKNTFSSCLLVLFVDLYGSDFLTWEPEAIRIEIIKRFGVPVTPLLTDKINAACGLVLNDLYKNDLTVFINTTAVLNNIPISTDSLLMLDPYQVMWGVTEARLIQGDSVFNSEPFNPIIAKYVGNLLLYFGLTKPPKPLDFAEFDPVILNNRDLILVNDRALYAQYEASQQAFNFALKRYVNDKLKLLFQQLQKLPLTSAVDDFKEKIDDILKEVTNAAETESQNNSVA